MNCFIYFIRKVRAWLMEPDLNMATFEKLESKHILKIGDHYYGKY